MEKYIIKVKPKCQDWHEGFFYSFSTEMNRDEIKNIASIILEAITYCNYYDSAGDCGISEKFERFMQIKLDDFKMIFEKGGLVDFELMF